MCEYYTEEEGDSLAVAGERISAIYQPGTFEDNSRGIGTCGLPDAKGPSGREIETWWSKNFEPEDGNPASICRTGELSGPAVDFCRNHFEGVAYTEDGRALTGCASPDAISNPLGYVSTGGENESVQCPDDQVYWCSTS